MTLRKAPPKVDESKFQKLIRRSSFRSATARESTAAPRTTVLLRLDPDLLEDVDTMARSEGLNRHALIVQILERITYKREGARKRG